MLKLSASNKYCASYNLIMSWLSFCLYLSQASHK